MLAVRCSLLGGPSGAVGRQMRDLSGARRPQSAPGTATRLDHQFKVPRSHWRRSGTARRRCRVLLSSSPCWCSRRPSPRQTRASTSWSQHPLARFFFAAVVENRLIQQALLIARAAPAGGDHHQDASGLRISRSAARRPAAPGQGSPAPGDRLFHGDSSSPSAMNPSAALPGSSPPPSPPLRGGRVASPPPDGPSPEPSSTVGGGACWPTSGVSSVGWAQLGCRLARQRQLMSAQTG